MSQSCKIKNGHGVGEYALIFGLLAFLCIGGLSLMSNQVNGLISHTVEKKALPAPEIIASPVVGMTGGSTLVLTGKNGKQFVLEQYPATLQSFTASIETVGAGGVTEYYAKLFERLSQLQDDTLLSQADRDYLKKLADAGFDLTRLQARLENSARLTGLDQIEMPDGKTQKLSAMNALQFINHTNALSPGFSEAAAEEAMAKDPRQELFQNPQMRALVLDAINKLKSASKGSIELVIEKLNQRSASTPDSKPLSKEALYNKLAQYSRNSFKGAKDLCGASATGTTNVQKLTCEKKP